jgi:hypothetical protein
LSLICLLGAGWPRVGKRDQSRQRQYEFGATAPNSRCQKPKPARGPTDSQIVKDSFERSGAFVPIQPAHGQDQNAIMAAYAVPRAVKLAQAQRNSRGLEWEPDATLPS